MNECFQAVTIKNKNNRTLIGILQQPQDLQHNIAIIFLSPGIKNRIGPHRLYVKMAARFIEIGFPILRVDPEGLGDSEGGIDEALTADVYASIQLGRYIDDTIVMMDWMQAHAGISRFILAGLCGGAITALLTAEKDARVQAILSLGIPCMLDSSAIDPLKYITAKQLSSIREKYLKKVLNLDAWKRFLSFRSDYRLLLRSLVRPVLKKKSPAAPANAAGPAAPDPPTTNLNPYFHRIFAGFVKKNKLLMIFSEADRLYWEFEEKYLGVHGKDIEPYRQNFRIELVKDANHVFSFTQWQMQMLDFSEKWLYSISHITEKNQ